jgi:hypothetical protein
MLASRIENLMAVISDPTSLEYMVLDAENKYNTALSASERISAFLRQKERALGSIERQQLHKLVTSPYLCDRMNALALKIRLRDKLRSRKFELERLERTFRKQVNGTQVFSVFNCIQI